MTVSANVHGANSIRVSHYQPDNANAIGIQFCDKAGATIIDFTVFELPRAVCEKLLFAFGDALTNLYAKSDMQKEAAE